MLAHPPWLEMLSPFGDSFGALVVEIERYCESLDSDRLQVVLSACDAPSETNCSWAVFQVAPVVARVAQGELARREARAAAREAIRL